MTKVEHSRLNSDEVRGFKCGTATQIMALIRNKNKKQEGKLKSKPSILIKKHVEHAIVLLLEVRSLGAFHRPAR